MKATATRKGLRFQVVKGTSPIATNLTVAEAFNLKCELSRNCEVELYQVKIM